jgi:Rrf2 family protein
VIQINRSTDYALRALTYLAGQHDGPCMVSEIAQDQGVPPKFLARILQILQKSGLVHSHRGIKGGFSLAKPGDQITVLQVLEAVEGPLSVSLCLTEPEICAQAERCPSLQIWARAQAAFLRVLAGTTVAELATQQQELDASKQLLSLVTS